MRPRLSSLLQLATLPQADPGAQSFGELLLPLIRNAPDPLLQMVVQVLEINPAAADERDLERWLAGMAHFLTDAVGLSVGVAACRRAVVGLAFWGLGLAERAMRAGRQLAWASATLDRFVPVFAHAAADLRLSDAEYRSFVRISQRHSDPTLRQQVVQRLFASWLATAPDAATPSLDYLRATAAWALASGQFDLAIATCRQVLQRAPRDPEAANVLAAAERATGALGNAPNATRR